MAYQSATWLDLWMAPYKAFSVMQKAVETANGAQSVIAKRMPVIMEAMTSPWTADLTELSLMVSEKIGAAAQSSRSAAAGQNRVRQAVGEQIAAMQRFAATGWLPTADWWGVGQRNLTIATTLMTLPGEMLGPYHKGVTGNVKRLRA